MMERLMTSQRTVVLAVLSALLGIMVLLWFIRAAQPNLANIGFFLISLLLIPLACFAVYGILYLTVRVNQISDRELRGACTLLFAGAVIYLIASVLTAVYDFATHRSLPSPNLLAFGVALGAMNAWRLKATTVSR